MKIAVSILLVILLFSAVMPELSVANAEIALTNEQILQKANSLVNTSYTAGYCLEWLAVKFWQALGAPYSSTCCAYAHGQSHIVSTSRNDIPIGANVYFSGSSISHTGYLGYNHNCGHIGVYVGNDKILSLVHYSSDPEGVAYGRINTIDQWNSWGYPYIGWGYPDGVVLESMIAAQNLEFRNVVYPKTYHIDTTYGWDLRGGLLVTNADHLVSIRSIIKRVSDDQVIDDYTRALSGKKFSIPTINTSVKFSNIKTNEEGKYVWTLIGTDSDNRTLTLDMEFDASTSKANDAVTAPDLAYNNGIHNRLEEDSVYVFTLNGTAIARNKPYVDAEEGQRYVKGDLISIVASVENDGGYKWYEAQDGSYIWNEDVTLVYSVTDAETKKNTIIQNTVSDNYPYESDPGLPLSFYCKQNFSAGDTITIEKTVINNLGETWYQLQADSFVRADYCIDYIEPMPDEDKWVYQVVTSYGLNVRKEANTSSGIVTTIFSPATITVTKKTTGEGYTWGYGTTSTGYTGWAVVDNDWSKLTDIPVTGITLNQTALSLNTGGTFSLTATVSPDNATNKAVNWTTSNSSVATVNENGVVTAVAPGTAVVTASATDGSEKTASCSVVVYTSASGGEIHVYNQWDTKYKSKGLANGNTMYDSGCGIFSMAHAYQWLSKDSMNQTQADSLLDTLIGVYNSPWLGDLSQYYNYMINQNIMSKHEGKYSSEAQYQSLFNHGGCVLLHPQGHYSLAVGMTRRDLNNDGVDETYVHVIDSVISATLGRWDDAGSYWTSHGYSAYYYSSFSKMNPNTSNCGRGKEFGQGGEYWLDYQSFSSIAQRCLWPAEQTASVETLEFRDVVYPKTFRIDTTYGWFLQGGSLVSDDGLTSLQSIITRDSDGAVIDNYTKSGLSGNTFVINSIDANVKFSNITTAGEYTWTLIGKDSSNRTLTMEMPFTAVSSGSSVTDKMSISYPTFIPVSEIVFTKKTNFENDDHIGASAIYSVQVIPTNATNRELAFFIDDELVASLSEITKVNDSVSVGCDYYITVQNMGIGTAVLTAASTDGSGISAQIPLTVVTNITWVEYHAKVRRWKEEINEYEQEIFDDVDNIQMLVGDKLLPAIRWGWTSAPDTYECRFFIDDSSLLSGDDDSWRRGDYYATAPGIAHVFVEFYQNDQLSMDINATFTIYISEKPIDPNPSETAFKLPAALKVIPNEAFEGISASYIVLGEAVEEIGWHAFANCGNLMEIYIPESVTFIDDDAFYNTTGFVILGIQDSEAQRFAERNHIDFAQKAEEIN